MISKKWYYPINIFAFNLSRLSPLRCKRLWLFGAWAGKKYDDNSRYFFEYVNKKYSDQIRAVWVAKFPEVAEHVRAQGYEAVIGDSWKGRWLQLRAGVVYYTNSLNDFAMVPLVGGAIVCTGWHGMSFKKIYNSKYMGRKLLTKKISDHIYSRTYRTVSVVTSEWAKHWFEESFTLNPHKIFITGQPRNDALRQVSRDDVLKQMGIMPNKKVILYLPTYRHAAQGRDAIQRLVEALYNDAEFDSMLDSKNYVFFVKPHYLTPSINLKSRENFIISSFKSVGSNQELLACGDILVTDYSGGFIDFALLNRPIIFYTPDEEQFLCQSEDIDKKFFEICNLNRARNPHELAIKLSSPSVIACDATNELWEDKSISGTCYSENVFRVLAREVGLE